MFAFDLQYVCFWFWCVSLQIKQMHTFSPEQRAALATFEQALQENKQPTEDAKLREKRRQAVDDAYARCLEVCSPDALTKAEHAAVRKPGL